MTITLWAYVYRRIMAANQSEINCTYRLAYVGVTIMAEN